ncbi:hypothetical protein L1987_23172 [Smallanthus sonchifolius]|uniref:Uncharacterized protein n=1 Tax=Smallanthus sonchifolius TaxID=185202 RepID=A0ACB9IGQ6_9ASTR|nr:hypothetical protein L1987_23172 [Smallanthus sonchifolius]
MDVHPARDSGFSSPSSHLRREFEYLLIAADANRTNSLAAVPFAWEERPGVPKAVATLFQDDFSFDVSRHFDSNPVPAEDLFQGGVIRTVVTSKVERERGRERGFSSSRLPSSRSRRTRSLPPPGVFEQRPQRMAPSSPVSSTENGSRKWSFMDLFLFRSASDGRAMDADPLKKYSANFRKHDQDVRNSGSMSKRRGRLSAHELHYNVNRAVSNDMKKKTYLPYKHGILGRFSFNP